jgi:hypothetical protein
MSIEVVLTATTSSTLAPAASTGRRPPRWIVITAAIAGSWLLPLLTHLLRLDALLPVVLVMALAAVLRTPRSVIDRLIVATCLVFGATCVAGLGLSIWPWGLHPVPIAGTAFTVLVLIAALTGRRPPTLSQLSRQTRLNPRDRLPAAFVLLIVVAGLEPFALRDAGGRLGLMVTGEDIPRHFVLYDVIGKLQGYAFLHPLTAAAFFPEKWVPTTSYPQGAHFVYAVLDRFWRSAGQNADGVTAMNFLVWCCVASFIFLAVAVLWGVNRVAGPGPTPWTMLPLLATIAAVVYFGDLVTVLVRGYPNQLVGLALVAVLTAVLIRPLPRLAEQLCLVAALVVGISFAYVMYLAYAGLATAAWALLYRRRLFRRPWLTAALGAGTAAAALVPVLVTVAGGGTGGSQVLMRGPVVIADRPIAAVLSLVAVLSAVSAWRARRNAPSGLALVAVLASAMFVVIAVFVPQIVVLGHTEYYFEKAIHLLIVVALVVLGGLGRLLPAVRMPTLRRKPLVRSLHARSTMLPGLLVAATVVALVAALGGPMHTTPGSMGLRVALGLEKGSPLGARDSLYIARRYPAGVVAVDLMHTPYANYFGTTLGVAMQREYRIGWQWSRLLYPAGPPKTLADMDQLVLLTPRPIKLLVQDPTASFLVIDPARPNRPVTGTSTPAFGEPGAPTNIQAAEYLAAKYPDRVEVIRVTATG